MMTLREFKEREVYKTAKYIKCVDIDGGLLPENKFFNNVTVLHYKETDDNGLIFKLWVCNTMPEGWRIRVGATTAPNGFCWISNGKSIFDDQFRTALLRNSK